MTDKIYIKKIVVGTPIKRVTSGAFNIENLSGVDVSATESDGSILAYKSSIINMFLDLTRLPLLVI